MERVSVNSVELAYYERGAGPVVLLVHGFPLDHQMWQRQIAELSSRLRVIAPDLRGFGRSDVTPGVVTMEQYADDLAGLLDVLGVREPVTFCGLSMGGYIAWQFVRRHRSRLARLILCDTKAAADSPEAAQNRRSTAQSVLADGPESLVQSLTQKLFAPQTLSQQPEVVQSVQTVMRGTSREGIAAALRGMAERPDVTDELGGIDLPSLVICGEHDAITTLNEMRQMAAAMPRSEFVTVPNAGHMAPLENSAVVNAALTRFLFA